MKCLAVVPNKWYHFREGCRGLTHPCPNNAKKDGYCYRHHPANLLPVHQAKYNRLEKQLAETKARLEQIRLTIEQANSGNPS